MYAFLYFLFALCSLPLAIFFDQIYNLIPAGFHMFYPSVFPVWGLLLVAMVGRFADAASTVIALQNPLIQEGAPGLGPRPEPGKLWGMAIWQSIILGVAGVFLSRYFLFQMVITMVIFMSFFAVISNLVCYIMAFQLQPLIGYHNYSGEFSQGPAIFLAIVLGVPSVILALNNPIAGIIIGSLILMLLIAGFSAGSSIPSGISSVSSLGSVERYDYSNIRLYQSYEDHLSHLADHSDPRSALCGKTLRGEIDYSGSQICVDCVKSFVARGQ
jgi:hypothetical protein